MQQGPTQAGYFPNQISEIDEAKLSSQIKPLSRIISININYLDKDSSTAIDKTNVALIIGVMSTGLFISLIES